jgi:hypothetical protein
MPHDFLDREMSTTSRVSTFFNSDWIKTGIKEERLIYRHWFNEAATPSRCSMRSWAGKNGWACTARPPADLAMQIGSQWWCLRRRTVEAVLAFIAAAAM